MTVKMLTALRAFVNMEASVLQFITDLNVSALLDSLVPDVRSMLMNVPLHPVIMVAHVLICLRVTGIS